MEIYTLAYELHCPVSEIMDLPEHMVDEWRQFFGIRSEQIAKARRKRG